MTLDEAKNHLRVDLNDDDSLITLLITTARQKAEAFTRRSFITQTWELTVNRFKDTIYLPRPDIQSISAVTLDGIVVDSSQYQADTDNGRVRFLSSYITDQKRHCKNSLCCWIW